MRILVVVALLFPLPVRAERVTCFSVGLMEPSDSGRYYVEAVSRCPDVLEAVYVKVRFLMPVGHEDSLWALYEVRHGKLERHEFAFPREALRTHSIVVLGIFSTLAEALGK